jgi:hypothetical protein
MRNSLVIALIVFSTSCGGDNRPDVVKFKSGEYGSRAGEFMAKFPAEPHVSSQHYQLGSTAEYDEFLFQYRVADEHLYQVSIVDVPPTILKGWDTEQLFDQSIKNMSAQLDDFKVTDRQVNAEKNFELSITYTLFSSTPGAMVKARFLKYGTRFYYVFFACTRRQPNTDKIDEFLDSFKIYKPKSEA